MRRYSMINLCPLRPRSYSRNTFSCFSALMQKFSVLPASAYFFLCYLKYTLIFVVFQYNILLIYKFLCAHKNVIYLLNINKKATRIFLRCYSKHGYCENNFPIQLFSLTLYFILTGFFGFSCFRFIFSSSYPFYYICIYVAKKPERLQRKINFFISALFSRHLIPSTIYVAKKPERLQRKINFFIFLRLSRRQ